MTTTQSLGVGQEVRHIKTRSDTSEAVYEKKCVWRLFPPFAKKKRPRNSRRILPPPLSKQSASFALRSCPVWRPALRSPCPPAPEHISDDLTARAISHTATPPSSTKFYSAVKIWVTVSTFGFNLLREGRFVQELQRKQAPPCVLCSHYKLQKGLRNGRISPKL